MEELYLQMEYEAGCEIFNDNLRAVRFKTAKNALHVPKHCFFEKALLRQMQCFSSVFSFLPYRTVFRPFWESCFLLLGSKQ
jgi:hypothetical protein